MVSVIIPTYNAGNYLPAAIDSVLGQTIKDIEVIVVDDGSTDNTKEIITPYLNRINYIYQKNCGPSSARNRGISCAKGDYIAFLDADEIWIREKLEIQLNFLRENPEYSMVYTDLLRIDKRKNLTFPFLKGRIAAQNGYIFEELITKNFIPTTTVVVKRECFDHVGLFDESLRSVEDRDMWLRIAQQDKIGFIETPTVIAEVHDGGLSSDREEALRSQIYVIKKYEKVSGAKTRQLIISTLSTLYFQLGYFYFDKGLYQEARENFKNSLSYGKKGRVFFLLILTYLRSELVEYVRRIRK